MEYTPQTIRTLRKRLRLTQQDMATHLGVAMSTYQGWEGGKSRPGRMGRHILDTAVANAPDDEEASP